MSQGRRRRRLASTAGSRLQADPDGTMFVLSKHRRVRLLEVRLSLSAIPNPGMQVYTHSVFGSPHSTVGRGGKANQDRTGRRRPPPASVPNGDVAPEPLCRPHPYLHPAPTRTPSRVPSLPAQRQEALGDTTMRSVGMGSPRSDLAWWGADRDRWQAHPGADVGADDRGRHM